MITFLDEHDVEYGALATIKTTNAVNGERSLSGTIVSGDYVLSNIERGWRLRFDDEYYVVTYAKPVDEGRDVQVTFDAVHQFFWDFDKSSVYDQLPDGSHTFAAYLDFIFKKSGYSYTVDSALNVHAFEKQSFGLKKRLTLFNDIITSTGVEFQVNGKVVRILEKVGTDLSTVVRKNFNMNELTIEKNIGDFVTYQKGYGAYFDEENHSKGRLVAEYTSPLASVYGKLEAEPFVDERYKQSSSLLAVLKENVDNSYTISVSLDMEDLTRAGYKYKQPVAGDYIMAINETLGFQEKIRIVSFASEYDVQGNLVKHEVTCNDIGTVKKLSASYNLTKKQASSASATASNAYSIANKALVSADGKNTNYYTNSFPIDNPKGTLKTGDLLFLTVGDTVKQYYWNGTDWISNPVVNDVEAFKEQITEELKDVPNREEFENKISEELANSKAEIQTQIDTAKTQAETNAKAYADEINQTTAEVAEQANTAANSLKSDLAKVKTDLTATTTTANAAKTSASEAKQKLATVADNLSKTKTDLQNAVGEVANNLSNAKTDLQNAVSEVNTKAAVLQGDLTKAKQDLQTQASQLTAQANAQSELTNRVSLVETTANGTKTTVSELSKTVAQNGKDITSVTARTKTVEDDLTSTKISLSQVQTTANSTSQKAATLETGLNGLSAKFDNLKIGGTNLLLYSADPWKAPNGYYQQFNGAIKTDETLNGSVVYKTCTKWSRLAMNWGKQLIDKPDVKVGDEFTYSVYVKTDQETPIKARLFFRYSDQSSAEAMTGEKLITQEWQRFTETFTVTQKMLSDSSKLSWVGFEQTSNSEDGKFVYYACNKLERGNIATDYSPNEADLEQKVSEYKQTADQNYASLQTTVQNLDGTVQQNKTIADQTAQGFSTRIESLETYKDGENTRASQYFESAKTETARQLTAERTAIAEDYVAKSTYTSDATGIRNDLTATTTTANTTKTNLANYQASNDKAVANLQSSLQTANGNISSLKTKVEAIPGQITSAVSAVEGKLEAIDQLNLIGAFNLTPQNATFDKTDYTLTSTTTTNTTDNRVELQFFDENNKSTGFRVADKVGKFAYPFKITKSYVNIRVKFNGNVADAGVLCYDKDLIKLNTDYVLSGEVLSLSSDGRGNGGQIKHLKIQEGKMATGFSKSPKDVDSDISKVTSEIKQTADGMTLLATKTELNAAKTDLQSGITTATSKADNAQSTANNNAQTINTHTTQISALNTGLSAKVSQSDFNTLSGRVTTAENNITAKANELSSKITSVEGKIPTSVGSTNLLLYSADPSKAPSGYYDFAGAQKTSETYNGSVIYKVQSAWKGLRVNLGNLAERGLLKAGDVLTYSVAMRADQKTPIQVRLFVRYKNESAADSPTGKMEIVNSTADWQYVSVTFTVTAKMLAENTKVTFLGWELTSNAESGKYVYYACNKIERGNVATDWSPAPEDTVSQINSLSSQITQTANGMTLLATKTELNNAKSDLQSGITTATNKANAAQSSANSNAQTISTHTTQISALNTGLSAKVSQSDFNTLSGRVTTAENNITAKANELSSKITSVEGKIPTSIGGTNLLLYSADPWKAPSGYYDFVGVIKTDETLNGSVVYKTRSAWGSLRSNWGKHLIDRKNVKVGDEFTYSIYAKTDQTSTIRTRLFIRFSGQSNADALTSDITLTNEWQKLSVTFKVTQKMVASQSKVSWVGFEQTSNSADGKFVYYACNKLERGKIATDWSPAPEDYDSKLATAQSEIKQTTDSIKASVSSLDNSTVKNTSLTINTDGIVMKAGKSTTDVANAIGSYFAVNQNAINLFTDKINVKGNMIVSGAITSDKIASKSINTAHLNGKIITADVIATGAITADAIKAGAVTTDKMSANSINGDRITAGTLDAAKIKAGSITASQIASGTITSSQIKAGGISAANIAAGAITTDKIAAGAINADKIAANAITADKIKAGSITADMFKGNQITSLNGATTLDLHTGEIIFNNQYATINQIKGSYKSQISLFSLDNGAVTEGAWSSVNTLAFNSTKLTSATRRAGSAVDMFPTFSLMTLYGERIAFTGEKSGSPGSNNAIIITTKPEEVNFTNGLTNNSKGKWNYSMIMNFGPKAAINVPDIKLDGHIKSLTGILDDLCKKAGIMWV